MFSLCLTCTQANKIKKERQTKNALKRNKADKSRHREKVTAMPRWRNNLHLHYVHAHTMHTEQLGTAWCAIRCVRVSILLCETAVFFYIRNTNKKELATKKCSTIIIYNCLDNETNNDKHCTNTYRQLQRTALEGRSCRSDKAWTPIVAVGTIPEKD